MELPSEHGGIPWGIAASLLHVHRVLLTVVALPAQQVTPAGGLSALQSGDSVIEGAAHRARRCEDEAEESAGSAGYFKDLSRLAAGRRQRARQPGVNSMACRTQKCRDYTAPGARQFNAWIYALASGRVRMLNWLKCFYPRDPSLSLPSVDRVQNMQSSASCGFPKAVNVRFKFEHLIDCIQNTDFEAPVSC